MQYNWRPHRRERVSIGLYLLARFNSPVQDPDRLLQQTAAWIHQHYSDVLPQTKQGFVETCPTLFCQLHPAAEELELSLIDLEHLTASANTSTVVQAFTFLIVLCCRLGLAIFKHLGLRQKRHRRTIGTRPNTFSTGIKNKSSTT